MKQDIKETLKKLCEADAISGYEKWIRPIIKQELEGHVDEIDRDVMGNLIAKKGNGKPIYMLTAHMDEIGFIVKHIDEQGYIRFIPVGGFWDYDLLNQNIIIHTKKQNFKGVMRCKDRVLMDEEETKNPKIKWRDMYIDIGAKSKQEVEKLGIKISDMITVESNFKELLSDSVTSTCMDDRSGCAVLVHVMKQLKKFKGTVYAVFTSQEEIGCKGAKTSAFKLDPDYSITVDVTPAHSAYAKDWQTTTHLGKGACIEYLQAQGRGIIAHPKLNKWIIEVAKENKIPIQLDAANAALPGRTDATEIQLTKAGIPSISIGIPCRYAHTNNEMINMNDVVNITKLIVKAIEKGRE